VGIDIEALKSTPSPRLDKNTIIARAEQIIPGLEDTRLVRADEISRIVTIKL
jgi:hypothetical protein